jgi:hypothetical protein
MHQYVDPTWTPMQRRVFNQYTYERMMGVGSDDPDGKKAKAAVTDFLKEQMTKDGFYRRIKPPLPLTDFVQEYQNVPPNRCRPETDRPTDGRHGQAAKGSQ